MILKDETIRTICVRMIHLLPNQMIKDIIQTLEVYPNTFLRILKEENKK